MRAVPSGWTFVRGQATNKGPLTWHAFDPPAAPRGGTGNGDRSHTVQVWVDAQLFVVLHSNDTSGPLRLGHVMRTAAVMSFGDYAAFSFELWEFFAHVFRSTRPNFYWPT